MQQQLLQSRDLSSNLIGRPVFLLYETEKFCRTGLKKKKKNICIFGARMFAVYVETSIEIYCLFQRVIASDIRFAFSRCVERP